MTSFSSCSEVVCETENLNLANQQVGVGDVREAFRLLEVAMQQSATDHATGQLNLLCPKYFFLCTNLAVLILLFLNLKGTIDMDLIKIGRAHV